MAKTEYRVVYGETCPAWERKFPTMREARAFAKKQKKLGDTIFSIARVIPGERPKSLAAAIDAADAEADVAYIARAIAAARAAADRLEAECPACQSNSPLEDAANELIHALRDAAGIADRAIQSSS